MVEMEVVDCSVAYKVGVSAPTKQYQLPHSRFKFQEESSGRIPQPTGWKELHLSG